MLRLQQILISCSNNAAFAVSAALMLQISSNNAVSMLPLDYQREKCGFHAASRTSKLKCTSICSISAVCLFFCLVNNTADMLHVWSI